MAGRPLSPWRKAALLDLGDQLGAVATVEAAWRIAGEFLSRSLGVARAGYALIDQAFFQYEVRRDRTVPGGGNIVGRHSLADFPATLEKLRRHEPVVVADIVRQEWLASDFAGYRSLGVKAAILIPLLDRGDLRGALFVHEALPRNWTAGECDLVGSVADRTCAAIAKLKVEHERQILIHELLHRLKNTLTMVQSIAAQTLRDVTDADAFDAFASRLVALSRAHDALLRRRGSSAAMRAVIADAMAPHCSGSRCAMSGPDLLLGSRATLSLTMLLHELATNAIKYGALSNRTGKLSIGWRIDGSDDAADLVLDWREAGGPIVVAPVQKGFGSRLVKLGLVGTGNVVTHYLPAGFEAEFRAPLGRLQQE